MVAPSFYIFENFSVPQLKQGQDLELGCGAILFIAFLRAGGAQVKSSTLAASWICRPYQILLAGLESN